MAAIGNIIVQKCSSMFSQLQSDLGILSYCKHMLYTTVSQDCTYLLKLQWCDKKINSLEEKLAIIKKKHDTFLIKWRKVPGQAPHIMTE